jgi:trans-aconitate methyltransferase
VDIAEDLLDAARRKAPGLTWVRSDLATVELGRAFDTVVLAGNVMIFVAPGTEGDVLANLTRHLTPDGRLIAGFQVRADRLSLPAFDAHAAACGLAVTERHATWDRDPYAGGDYAVSVLERA